LNARRAREVRAFTRSVLSEAAGMTNYGWRTRFH
jgi:hypothetical protein